MIIMKNQAFKKIIYCLIAVVMMSMLSGCSFIPELQLTEEQSELIAEYSAGLLCKYQIGHTMGMTPLSVKDFQKRQPVVVEEAFEESAEAVEETENAQVEDVSADNPPDGEIEMVSSSVPIGSMFGLDGVDISYNYYEFTRLYPKEESEDLVFSMQASPNTDLLVVHFNVSNITNEMMDINLTGANVKARVTINGGSRIPAQATILDNDLQNYYGSINGGETVDGVLIFEIPLDNLEQVNSINLILKGSEGENLYSLL